MRRDTFTKIYTVYIILLPIIQYYKSPIPSLNLATVIVCLLLMASPVYIDFRRLRFERDILVYLGVFLVCSIITLGFNSDSDIVLVLRYAAIILVLSLYSKEYFDIQYGIRALYVLLLMSVIMMAIQYICYYFIGFKISATIPMLMRDEAYSSDLFESSFRASGLFMEPSHLATSGIVLALYLLTEIKNDNEKNRKKMLSVSIIAIIVSGSGMGYVFLLVVVGMSIVSSSMNLSKKAILIFGIIITIVIICVFPNFFDPILSRMSSESVQDASSSSRFLNSISRIGGVALLSRLASLDYFFRLDTLHKLVGVGAGGYSIGLYGSSLTTSLYQYGYISLCYIIPLIIKNIISKKQFRRRLGVLLVLMIAVASPLDATNFPFFTDFLY